MDFTIQAEDEVKRDAVSPKLYRPLVNPSKNVWRNSTQTQDPIFNRLATLSDTQIRDIIWYNCWM